MPQVWLTYDELGEWIGCGADQAGRYVAEIGWHRRRCSDGLIRVKLVHEIMDGYFLHYEQKSELARQADIMVGGLRSLLARAANPARTVDMATPQPTLRSA